MAVISPNEDTFVLGHGLLFCEERPGLLVLPVSRSTTTVILWLSSMSSLAPQRQVILWKVEDYLLISHVLPFEILKGILF